MRRDRRGAADGEASDMMISQLRKAIAGAALAACVTVPAWAQEARPKSLKVFFDSGSASIAPDQQATLDQAVRTWRDGDWIVMVVAGVADTVGPAELNLSLSLARAAAVADSLADRGIPTARLQVHGRGNSELEVETEDDVAEPANRVAEITWR